MITIGNPQDEGSIGAGIGIGLGLNVVVFVVLLFTGNSVDQTDWLARIFHGGVVGIGLLQLVYIVPLYLYYRKKGEKDTAKGLVIIASFTALLNVACGGLLGFLTGHDDPAGSPQWRDMLDSSALSALTAFSRR